MLEVNDGKFVAPKWARHDVKGAIAFLRSRYAGFKSKSVWPDSAIVALLAKAAQVYADTQSDSISLTPLSPPPFQSVDAWVRAIQQEKPLPVSKKLPKGSLLTSPHGFLSRNLLLLYLRIFEVHLERLGFGLVGLHTTAKMSRGLQIAVGPRRASDRRLLIADHLHGQQTIKWAVTNLFNRTFYAGGVPRVFSDVAVDPMCSSAGMPRGTFTSAAELVAQDAADRLAFVFDQPVWTPSWGQAKQLFVEDIDAQSRAIKASDTQEPNFAPAADVGDIHVTLDDFLGAAIDPIDLIAAEKILLEARQKVEAHPDHIAFVSEWRRASQRSQTK